MPYISKEEWKKAVDSYKTDTKIKSRLNSEKVAERLLKSYKSSSDSGKLVESIDKMKRFLCAIAFGMDKKTTGLNLSFFGWGGRIRTCKYNI